MLWRERRGRMGAEKTRASVSRLQTMAKNPSPVCQVRRRSRVRRLTDAFGLFVLVNFVLTGIVATLAALVGDCGPAIQILDIPVKVDTVWVNVGLVRPG